ncbi:hypothetical protein KMT30_48365, partial [Streptomyces sp. IBSBF 2953]|nr:hypothetical protein [Streptomyces hayashii]
AAGGSPATRTSFTSPAADDRTGAAGAKAGEGPRVKQAPETRPAPYGDQAGPKASIVSGPAAPTARQVLPAGAPETTESRSDEPDGGDHT